MGRPRIVTPLVTLPSVHVCIAWAMDSAMAVGRKGTMDLPVMVVNIFVLVLFDSVPYYNPIVAIAFSSHSASSNEMTILASSIYATISLMKES
eukprot:8404652-Ditylum_brightwellii.AAC.1